jgi:dihydrofolate reductase
VIILIACIAKNRVIGRDGKLPWHFPADLKHFKTVTTGNIVVMGHRTFKSVGVLPKRDIVVLSRKACTAHYDSDGVRWTPSLEDVVSLSNDRDVFIAGGSQVYEQCIPLADYMMLTYIHQNVDGDTVFPNFEASWWDVVTARRGNKHSYLELRRKC